MRVESKLVHAELSLLAAVDMVERAELHELLPDLMIRRSYVAHELNRPERALSLAESATLGYARVGNREGEGRGFLTSGMFRYYTDAFREALRDLAVTVERSSMPRRLIAAHQASAFCWLGLGNQREARSAVLRARKVAPAVDLWMQGKLFWFEAKLAEGREQLHHLLAAQNALCLQRPADCALITIEIVEAALEQGENALAEDHVLSLCALLEKTASPRVEQAMAQLIRRRSSLTPGLVARIRQALDSARDERLISVVRAEL